MHNKIANVTVQKHHKMKITTTGTAYTQRPFKVRRSETHATRLSLFL